MYERQKQKGGIIDPFQHSYLVVTGVSRAPSAYSPTNNSIDPSVSGDLSGRNVVGSGIGEPMQSLNIS